MKVIDRERIVVNADVSLDRIRYTHADDGSFCLELITQKAKSNLEAVFLAFFHANNLNLLIVNIDELYNKAKQQ